MIHFIDKYYICFLLLYIIPFIGYSQDYTSHININDGLINNEVTSIVQDKNGFIWFGTRGGLQRYDGYNMKLLKNDIRDVNLKSQSIEILHNGLDDNIWIGTKSGGLSSYEFKTGAIKNFENQDSIKKGFNADYILSVLDTEGGKVFVGTWKGFQYFDKQTNTFTVINHSWKSFDIKSDFSGGFWVGTDAGLKHIGKNLQVDKSFNFGIQGINITSIIPDSTRNCLWLGTWKNGLIRFDLKQETPFFYRVDSKLNYRISSDDTYKIFKDSKGTLWVGTWGGGLFKFDQRSNSFQKVSLDIPGMFTNDNEIILSIMEDRSGLLWVCTDGAGVFLIDLNKKNFSNIKYDKQNQFFKTSTHVLAVTADKFNRLWFGTKGGGIEYSTDRNDFHKLNLDRLSADSNLPTINDARDFLEDGNYFWIATQTGLVRMTFFKNEMKDFGIFFPKRVEENGIRRTKVNVLEKDVNGDIWVGTQEDGLSKIIGYNKKNQPVFKYYAPAIGTPGALQNERVSALLSDSKGRLWVGTYKGLHLYLPEVDSFICFTKQAGPEFSISNNTILCLAEDVHGNIWAGTQYGLNRISLINNNKLTGEIFTIKNGLSSDYIHAILPDKFGNIWTSTNKGINKLNPEKKSNVYFDKRDGIQSIAFSENASCKTRNNVFFFGGVEGITFFTPDSINISTYNPPLYFTSLKVNNIPYEYGYDQNENAILNGPFYQAEAITLNYKQNIFSIEFSSLDYHAPDKNEYMYILDGFNENWVQSGNSRVVSYTNLPSGTYYLRVKGTNSDKIWNPDAHFLKITILPPPWKTWWAYGIYVGLFMGLLWGTRYLGLLQVKLKNKLRIAEVSNIKERELAEYKEKLFTNISHEFRTPLTLILGPLEDLMQRKQFEMPVTKSLKLIQKQSRRMLRMVNQLLDFEKSEANKLRLELVAGELVSFCYDIFSLFSDEADRRKIQYVFHSDEKYISAEFDPDKMEIIIFNILSNAFKFTPDGGRIDMYVKNKEDGFLKILVKDNGKGIDKEDINKIFDRFYQGKRNDALNISGTGIGLSFVKELIELHGGNILAESDGIKGSVFTLTFPERTEPLNNYHEGGNSLLPVKNIEMENNMDEFIEDEDYEESGNGLPIVVVVDDEMDMLYYISEILSPSFNVVTAKNGKDGLQKIFDVIPDLVVSDVMMPEIDGIELCKTVKSDTRTSHIPVILLTALTDVKHHVIGISEGADVYLRKPFNAQLLLVHIHNLITSRQKLKEIYAKKIMEGGNQLDEMTLEDEFLNAAMKLVASHIADSEFNNDELASKMYMSKSTLYRKLKALTGISGNKFIRSARLKHASKLLLTGRYSVTDAALESGFNSIKYFRKCFQEQFGVTPMEYKKRD